MSANSKTHHLEIIQSEEQKEKKNEESLMDLWDTIKRNDKHILGVLEREEREKETENIFKDIV